jgi:hypothetical protein
VYVPFLSVTMTSNQQSSNEAQSFDTFIPSIVKVTKTFETLQRRLEKLEQVNSRLIIFNESFSAFLYGIAVTDATSVWPEVSMFRYLETP